MLGDYKPAAPALLYTNLCRESPDGREAPTVFTRVAYEATIYQLRSGTQVRIARHGFRNEKSL